MDEIRISQVEPIYSIHVNTEINNELPFTKHLAGKVIIGDRIYYNLFNQSWYEQLIDNGSYKDFMSIISYTRTGKFYTIKFGIDTTYYLMSEWVIAIKVSGGFKLLLIRDNEAVYINPVVFKNKMFRRIKSYIEKYILSKKRCIIDENIEKIFCNTDNLAIPIEAMNVNEISTLKNSIKQFILDNVVETNIVKADIEEHDNQTEFIAAVANEVEEQEDSNSAEDTTNEPQAINPLRDVMVNATTIMRELAANDDELDSSAIENINPVAEIQMSSSTDAVINLAELSEMVNEVISPTEVAELLEDRNIRLVEPNITDIVQYPITPEEAFNIQDAETYVSLYEYTDENEVIWS